MPRSSGSVAGLLRAGLAVGILLGLARVVGAPPLLPPSLSIRQPHHALVVGTIVEILDDARLRVRRDRVLQEDVSIAEAGAAPPAEVTIRIEPGPGLDVEVGASYLLAYSSLVPVPKQRHTFSPDPRGPRLVDVPSVGPALFEDSAAMRRLLEPRPGEAELAPRERLGLILEQLERPDRGTRRFVLAELLLRRHEMATALGETEVARLRAAVDGGELDERSREYLFRVCLPLADLFGGDWLAAAARRELAALEPELDLLTAGPSLAVAVLEALERYGRPGDVPLLLEFLVSNNDAVSLQALRAAIELDPERTASEVAPLAWEGDLPRDTAREAVRFLAGRSEPVEGPGG